jgi:hypothetical protein
MKALVFVLVLAGLLGCAAPYAPMAPYSAQEELARELLLQRQLELVFPPPRPLAPPAPTCWYTSIGLMCD